MAPRHILHMLSPLKHTSPFDVNMAVDAGFDVVSPYINVTPTDVTSLVQDAIFSRGPEGIKRESIFIAGKKVMEALDMLERAKAAMVPPFEISVFADPAGSFTTAAAMVACVAKTLKEKFSTSLSGKRVVVYGGTGVVGFSSAVIAGLQKSNAVIVGYDGPERVAKLAAEAKKRFGVDMESADGSTEAQKGELVRDADVVFSAGPAGVRLLTTAQLKEAPKLLVATDVNAVPPSGVEGIGVNDDAESISGTKAFGIGALVIGNVKYQTQCGLFRRMIESEKPLYLDFREAFAFAQTLTK